MIVVTDGGDTTSAKDFHAALEAAQMADAVIYPILVMPITNDAGRNIGGENALATMAAGTGGRVFAPSIGADLDAAFAEIIRELRTQYLLGFYPRDVPVTANRFHKLEVRVRRQGLRVSARNGYYGDAEADSGERRREK
jgi:Ca-activated chloride channel family protein